MRSSRENIRAQLQFIYGEQQGLATFERLESLLDAFRQRNPTRKQSGLSDPFSERDAVLIAYADHVRQTGQTPLAALNEYLRRYIQSAVSTVHLLPFFPYSSDDGFSVIDYEAVDPEVGTWDDVREMGHAYRLMLDAVINHISRESRWFQQYLAGAKPYDGYFIEVDPSADTSSVVRPRALPLLTEVSTSRGPRHVWTTFSDDQIDLNYANPDVMLDMIRVLLLYVERGADLIRLDAIAYLWKELGTSSIHLPQTHAAVKLWRAVLDNVAPSVKLITETNVPHEENISYFGDGTDEAQLVYQFPLAPLTLHAFSTGNAEKLTTWAQSLALPSAETTFFNFIASHDGIGVRPAEGILTPAEIQALVDRTVAHRGKVSFRNQPDGSRSVYELNITLYDFLNHPQTPDPEIDVRRFLASQVIMISLAGLPGIYFLSLVGGRNCYRCEAETGRFRSLNRRKYSLTELEAEIGDPDDHAGKVLEEYVRLLALRSRLSAFHPNAAQVVLELHPSVFALKRSGKTDEVLCLVNVSDQAVALSLPGSSQSWTDVINRETLRGKTVHLAGYQARWLQKTDN